MQNPTSFCILHPCTLHILFTLPSLLNSEGQGGREGGRGGVKGRGRDWLPASAVQRCKFPQVTTLFTSFSQNFPPPQTHTDDLERKVLFPPPSMTNLRMAFDGNEFYSTVDPTFPPPSFFRRLKSNFCSLDWLEFGKVQGGVGGGEKGFTAGTGVHTNRTKLLQTILRITYHLSSMYHYLFSKE